jgi:hypothetical protein
MAALLVSIVLLVGTASDATGTSHSARFIATLELQDGEIDFPVELNTMHLYDEDDVPFMVQVIDGCAINDHLWVFAASLTDELVTMSVFDRVAGILRTLVLPALESGVPVHGVFDPLALAACGEQSLGGLPELTGTAIYSAAARGCQDDDAAIRLQSNGRSDAYRVLLRRAADANRVIADESFIAAIDDNASRDELHLLVEGRTPRHIEGVVFSGAEGMLPKRAKLDTRLKQLTYARVRRAFEAAKNERVPDLLIDDLGLKRVDCVHHVSLDFTTPDASVYLETAGWVEDGGSLPEPAALVAPRFDVDVVAADGSTTPLSLVGPHVGTDADGMLWRYADEQTVAQIVDKCQFSGAYWTLAASASDAPAQLIVTEIESGDTAKYPFDQREATLASVSDTAALRACG